MKRFFSIDMFKGLSFLMAMIGWMFVLYWALTMDNGFQYVFGFVFLAHGISYFLNQKDIDKR